MPIDRGDLLWRTIPGMFRSAVAHFPDKVAVFDGDRKITYSELADVVDSVSRSLIALGIASGDRVVVWLPNSWQWIACALGILQAGAVIVPANTRFKAHELGYVLEQSGARLIFLRNSFLGTDMRAIYEDAASQLRSGKRDWSGNATAVAIDAEGAEWQDFLSRGTAIDQDAVASRLEKISGDTVSDIMFTSGTTGFPKGVLLKHRQSLRAYFNTARIQQQTSDDVYGIIVPFFHSFGFKEGWLKAFMTGAAVCSFDHFDAGKVLQAIEQHRITYLPGPPTIMQGLIDHPDRSKYDLSSLRISVVGATFVPEALVGRMRDELGFKHVLTAYGLTEATALVSMSRIGDPIETIAATIGRPVDDVEVRIVKDDGAVADGEELGELQVRGYNVMSGYYNDAEATAKRVTKDGWLRTGDLVQLRPDGYLVIRGRLTDMLIVGGFNVYPLEVENMLRPHPAIADVSVVGKPDERLGEVAVAFVILREGRAVSDDELTAWARDRMANYKVPRVWKFVRAFPMNASGKVVKKELVEQL